MTLRRWLTLASTAALIAGTGACKNSNSGGSDTTGAGAQGRRGDTMPRARGADAGSDMTTGSGSTAGSSGGISGSSGSATGTTGSTGKSPSGSPSDTGSSGATGTSGSSSSGSTSGNTNK